MNGVGTAKVGGGVVSSYVGINVGYLVSSVMLCTRINLYAAKRVDKVIVFIVLCREEKLER
jgi:hypothetical protein